MMTHREHAAEAEQCLRDAMAMRKDTWPSDAARNAYARAQFHATMAVYGALTEARIRVDVSAAKA